EMKKRHRALKGTVYDSLHTIQEQATGTEYTKHTDKDTLVRRIIGRIWTQSPKAPKQFENERAKWDKYANPHPADKLTNIGSPPTMEEVERAYKRMGLGKATHSDGISKELLELAPREYKRLFAEYVIESVSKGKVYYEEGDTEVVLLVKKQNAPSNEVTNLRPISLVKFVTKWTMNVITHRIQERVQHLDNYGFQKQRSTAAAVRKITAILENARLKGIPAHMLTVDIEKAYDTVPYELMDYILCKYECPQHIRTLILDAHRKRAIKFKINGVLGDIINPERGVAQGSPLSCILFVMCMQPLLTRLQHETSGIVGKNDDTAYVDDLSLLAPSAEELNKKWKIVQEFEEWTSMHANKGKCEYDTTEPDKTKWLSIAGVKNMREEQNQYTMRILGYWMNTVGEREDQLNKIVTSMRITANLMRRKLISPQIARGVLNLIMSTRLQYVAQLHYIPHKSIKQMERACNILAKSQFGLPNSTANAALYAKPDTQLGLGLEHPGDVANRTIVDEYVKALNSTKESYTASILKENIELVKRKSWNVKTQDKLRSVTSITEHAPNCRTHRKAVANECICGIVSYWDTT
ncbi:MAG TPA: reverse transcriptase family protein, partial [Oculatellaceae cyanobacterium]